MIRRLLPFLLICGCAGPDAAPSDGERLRSTMGRIDRLKHEIQATSHEPGPAINTRVAAIEAAIHEVSRLKPFGDARDGTLAAQAAKALPRLGDLKRLPWTSENLRDRWMALESVCISCHTALETP